MHHPKPAAKIQRIALGDKLWQAFTLKRLFYQIQKVGREIFFSRPRKIDRTSKKSLYKGFVYSYEDFVQTDKAFVYIDESSEQRIYKQRENFFADPLNFSSLKTEEYSHIYAAQEQRDKIKGPIFGGGMALDRAFCAQLYYPEESCRYRNKDTLRNKKTRKTMKQILLTLRVVLLFVATLMAGSHMLAGQTYPTNSYVLSEDKTTLLEWKGTESEIDLESDAAFADLKTIGTRAFAFSDDLKKLRLSAGVIRIEKEAFLLCTALEEILLNEGLQSVGERAFAECDTLTSIHLPRGTNSIEKMAFSLCDNLEAITVAEDNQHYKSHEGVLYDIAGTSLIACGAGKKGAYTIPDGVKTIEGGAFAYCKKLTSITLCDGIETIGSRVFLGCSALTSVTLPHTVVTLGGQAFELCKALQEVRLSNALTSIGPACFKDCGKLTSIVIPPAVKTIDDEAFMNCKSLTQIDIPASVTDIRAFVFYECSNIKAFNVAPDNPVYSSHDGILYDKEKTIALQCGMAWTGDYEAPEGVETIGGAAFNGCSRITSVKLPNTVTLIDGSAFRECTNMVSLSLGENVERISGSAFSRCRALKKVVVPDATITLGTDAFAECSSLETVHLGKNLQWINNCAFMGCTSLKSIELPHSVRSLEARTFMDCSSLESVSIGRGITTMGIQTFNGCSSLMSITAHRETPPTLMNESLDGVPQEVTLYVPEGSIPLYAQADEWNRITNILAINYTSTQETTEVKIRLYPNPATDYLWMEIPSTMIGTHAGLIDVNGRLIRDLLLTNERMSIDLKALPAGLYFLRLGATTEKIIVERK